MITLTMSRLALASVTTLLRTLHSRHGISGSTAAEIAGFSQSRFSKLENGKMLLTHQDADLLADVFCADESERGHLYRLVEECQDDNRQRRVVLHRGTSRWLVAYREARQAAEVTAVGVTCIPETLQTAAYMLAANAIDDPAMCALVDAEVEARHQLLRSGVRRAEFLLFEQALKTVVGGPFVMAEVIRQIIGLASPQVTIRLVPTEAVHRHLSVVNNFELYDESVYVPTATGALIFSGATDLGAYRGAVGALRRCALTPSESLAHMSHLADDYYRRADRVSE